MVVSSMPLAEWQNWHWLAESVEVASTLMVASLVRVPTATVNLY